MGGAVDIKLLTDRAFEHALKSIEGAEGPLTAFTFVLDSNPDRRNRTLALTRYATEHLEQGLQQARQSIGPNPNASMYAIVWDGFATVDGRKWDAILVEVGENAPQGALYAQCYEAKERGFFSKKRRNVAVGKPLLVGAVPSRLWAQA
jgi:hypothetical protein